MPDEDDVLKIAKLFLTTSEVTAQSVLAASVLIASRNIADALYRVGDKIACDEVSHADVMCDLGDNIKSLREAMVDMAVGLGSIAVEIGSHE